MLTLNEPIKNIITLPRYAKIIIAIFIDISLCVLSTWFAFYLRLEEFIRIDDVTIIAVLMSMIAIPIFWLFGLYKALYRFAGSSIAFTVALAILSYGLLYFSVVGIYGIQGIPRSIGIIQPLFLFFGIISSRSIVRYLYIKIISSKKSKYRNKVLIYGAGNAGRQLLTSLENNNEMKVVGFLDDDISLHNQRMQGQIVFSPLKIKD